MLEVLQAQIGKAILSLSTNHSNNNYYDSTIYLDFRYSTVYENYIGSFYKIFILFYSKTHFFISQIPTKIPLVLQLFSNLR